MTASRTTALQRTYRYLRIAIAGTVVVIFVSTALTIPSVGLLPSLSHYYYTPARTMFVGALVAVAVCFFALSGRGPERVLLDVAAVLIPLVAIVPTVISPGSIEGVEAACTGSCLPPSADADVDNGVATYLVVGALIVVLAAALAAAGQVDRPGTALSIAIAAVVLLAVWLTWWLWPAAFYQWGHFASAVGFFATIAAVAVVNAFWPSSDWRPVRWVKNAYVVIAIAIAAVVAGMPLYGALHVGDVFGVFVGEVAALLLFVAFWVLQSIQYWNAPDPALRRP